jgi:hypothetical protein
MPRLRGRHPLILCAFDDLGDDLGDDLHEASADVDRTGVGDQIDVEHPRAMRERDTAIGEGTYTSIGNRKPRG